MRIYEEKSLRNFEFWSGGRDSADVLTGDQLDAIEEAFEEMYPDGMEDTQINDTFWFDEDWVAQQLGFKNFGQLQRYNEEGEKYVIRLNEADEDYGDEISLQFETKEEAEEWVDEEMEDSPEFQQYVEECDTVDVYICNTVYEDDYYYYKTIEQEENENEED